MRHTWRWFGPHDLVGLEAMLQAGVEGVVTALHHVPTGDIWTAEEISKRQAELATLSDGAASNLAWEVVESLPVSEDIKKQKGDWRDHIANYKTSLRNLANASGGGISTICYNFMPILDWTRTDLAWQLPHRGTLAVHLQVARHVIVLRFEHFQGRRFVLIDTRHREHEAEGGIGICSIGAELPAHGLPEHHQRRKRHAH